jgi:hypothetical protein
VSLSRTGGQGAKGDTGSIEDSFPNATDEQILRYDEENTQWTTHTLTTTSLSDIDNTNRTDGSMLIYSTNSSKYEATNTIGATGTVTLNGGTF